MSSDSDVAPPESCDLSQFYVKLDDYVQLTSIGSGGYGRVYSARHKTTGEIVAIKEVLCDVNDSYAAQRFTREVEILATAGHPTLLGLSGCTPFIADPTHPPAILTPFMSNGSLDNMLNLERNHKSPPEWTPTRKHIVLFGIATGMMIMHDRRLIHRDLKPANVLLDNQFEPKIADFGFSKFVQPGESLMQSMNLGTAPFMAPEIFIEPEFNFKVDVYAFGILMYMVVTGLEPFPNLKTQFAIAQKVMAGDRPPIPDSISPAFRSLITECWHPDPSLRPSFKDITDRLGELEFRFDVDREIFQEYQIRVSPKYKDIRTVLEEIPAEREVALKRVAYCNEHAQAKRQEAEQYARAEETPGNRAKAEALLERSRQFELRAHKAAETAAVLHELPNEIKRCLAAGRDSEALQMADRTLAGFAWPDEPLCCIPHMLKDFSARFKCGQQNLSRWEQEAEAHRAKARLLLKEAERLEARVAKDREIIERFQLVQDEIDECVFVCDGTRLDELSDSREVWDVHVTGSPESHLTHCWNPKHNSSHGNPT
jgi:hypothetical protein